MNRFALCLLLMLGAVQTATAAGVVRIADGDCVGLRTALRAAQPHSQMIAIQFASRGSYPYCPFTVSGNVTIDGAGATVQVATSPDVAAIDIAAGASVTIRNVNLVPTPTPIPPIQGSDNCGFDHHSPCGPNELPVISNEGYLLLDSVSLSGVPYESAFFLISNSGNLTLRNTSIVSNDGGAYGSPTIVNSGNLEISQSTLTGNRADADGLLVTNPPGATTVANSILTNNTGPNCESSDAFSPLKPVSLGGNITDDASCEFHAANDRIVANTGFADFGNHGGVVGTLALNYNSPAVGNGVAANCEATDARGAARGQNSCDSGVYEFGGGQGQLEAAGVSGLYYSPTDNGHFISVQRLNDNKALVIWNTFDQKGAPAWVFGVGSVNGSQIHVAQVAENLDGILHPGGAVTGVMPSIWGTFDFSVQDCYSATLNYQSPLPLFGAGTVYLQRLAFVNGVDCSK